VTIRPPRAAALAGVLAAWALTVCLVLVSFTKDFIDLMVYRAGGHAWASGVPLYGAEFPAQVGLRALPFTYPPVSAVLFAPLAAIPLPVAVVLHTVAGLTALAVTAWLTARRLEADQWRAAHLAMTVIVLAVLAEPVRQTLTFGQVNLVLMGLVAADCLVPRTPWPRGVLIGLAAAIKLTPAVFVLFFLAHRQWRPALAAGTAFLVATVAGFLAAPQASATYWFSGVFTDPGRIGTLDYRSNQSIAGLLHRFGLPAPWVTAVWLLAVSAALAAGWMAVRRLRGTGHDVAALLAVATTGLLASPVSWSHHYVWVVPALVWLGYRARRSARQRLVLVLFAVVFAVGPHWLMGGEAGWGLGAQIVGNAYVWSAVLALFAAAFGPIGPAVVPDRSEHAALRNILNVPGAG
jgi:alpha-1,2-mannosyltransferase